METEAKKSNITPEPNKEMENTIVSKHTKISQSKKSKVLIWGISAGKLRSILFSIQSLIYLATSIALVTLHLCQEVAYGFTFDRMSGSYHAAVTTSTWRTNWPIYATSVELYVAIWAEAVLRASELVSEADPWVKGSPINDVLLNMWDYNDNPKTDEFISTVFASSFGEYKHYYAPGIDRQKYPCVIMGWENFDGSGCRINGDYDTDASLFPLLDTALEKLYRLQCDTEPGTPPIPEVQSTFGKVCTRLSIMDKQNNLNGRDFILLGLTALNYDSEYRDVVEQDINDKNSYTQLAVRYALFNYLRSTASENKDISSYHTYISTLRVANTTAGYRSSQIQIVTQEEILSTTNEEVYTQSWKYKGINYMGSLPVFECMEGICERHIGDFIYKDETLNTADTACFPETTWSKNVRSHRKFLGWYDKDMSQNRLDLAARCIRLRDNLGTGSYDNYQRGTNYIGMTQRGDMEEVPKTRIAADFSGYWTTSIMPNNQIFIETTPILDLTNSPDDFSKLDRMIVLADAKGVSYKEYNNRLSLSPIAQWMVFCSLMVFICKNNSHIELVGQYLYNSFIVQLCGLLLWIDYYFAFYANFARKETIGHHITIDDVVLGLHAVIGYFALCQWGGKHGAGKMSSILLACSNSLFSLAIGFFFVIWNSNMIKLNAILSGTSVMDEGCTSGAEVCYTTSHKYEIPITGCVSYALGYIFASLIRLGFKSAHFPEKQKSATNDFFVTVHEQQNIANLMLEIDRKIFIVETTDRTRDNLSLEECKYAVDIGFLAILGYVIVDDRIVRQRDVLSALLHSTFPPFILSDSKLTYTYWMIERLHPLPGVHIGVYTKIKKGKPQKTISTESLHDWKSLQCIL